MRAAPGFNTMPVIRTPPTRPPMSPEPYYNRRLHWLALATAVATFPLIFMGGLVTTKQAGMSVPDWPNSYGYNMFLFPPNQWVGGVFYEHTHRLMGSVVGLLSLALALQAYGPAARRRPRLMLGVGVVLTGLMSFFLTLILVTIRGGQVPNVEQVFRGTARTLEGMAGLFVVLLLAFVARRRDPRPAVRWVCLAVLGMVILQGVLGGLRVVLVELKLAVVHACVAQTFLCLAALAALVTSRLWDRLAPADAVGKARPAVGLGFVRLAAAAVAVVYLQLVVGATMRHYDAGLAVPDVPLHYGKVLPPTDAAGLAAANLARAASGHPDLRPVTLGQIWLHVGHRAGAVLVTVVLGVVVWRALRYPAAARPALRNPAVALVPLVLAQLTLGVLTVLLRKPADLASLHVACGALVLVTTFALAARSGRAHGWRLGSVRDEPTPEARGFGVLVPAAGRGSTDRQNDGCRTDLASLTASR
ncbi:MAG: cytochrome c oxidase assembly protein subunit 15 [Phycisphaerales bacterium]|nr:cytochrome c oxidase assembly protein subunit 15 [Phycisphaerales bacterium]